jgi:hypothetical protein
MPGKSNDRSLMKRLRDQIRRLLRKKSPPEADPYAYVTAPLRRGPKGRSGAAVAEIEDDSDGTAESSRHQSKSITRNELRPPPGSDLTPRPTPPLKTTS